MMENEFLSASELDIEVSTRFEVGSASDKDVDRNRLSGTPLDRINQLAFDPRQCIWIYPLSLDWIRRSNQILTFISDSPNHLNLLTAASFHLFHPSHEVLQQGDTICNPTTRS